MEKYPKEIEIQRGEKALIRPIAPGDKKSIEEFLLKIPSKEKFFFNEAVEESGSIENWIEETNKSASPAFLAEKDEEIVGIISSRKAKGGPTAHFQDMILLVDIDYRITRLASFLSREYFSQTLKKGKRQENP